MQQPTVILLLSLCLLAGQAVCNSCQSCTTSTECQDGFYCCNNSCNPLPKLGEQCPCSVCPSGLTCQEGVCVFNGLSCSCNTVEDCTLDLFMQGGQVAGCVNNTCQLSSSIPPVSYFTPGGPCGSSCRGYCVNNTCSYTPDRVQCDGNTRYSCLPGSSCTPNLNNQYICQAHNRAQGEECIGDFECASGTCRNASLNTPATCMALGEVGDFCTNTLQCNYMNCTNNACALPNRGEKCFQNSVCAPGDTCGFNFICVQKASKANTEQCHSNDECQSSICNGVCWPQSQFGGSCNVTEQCPNGRCINNKCYGLSFAGEKCNATFTCFDINRPCKNGICPAYYTPLGDSCLTNDECAVGSCSAGKCDYPVTCNATSDCGKNLVCDCGQCKFISSSSTISNVAGSFYGGIFYQLQTREPEKSCIINRSTSAQCLPIIAKYFCYAQCSYNLPFPNGLPSSVKIDCATLTVQSLNVTKQPCCGATSQGDCNDGVSNCHLFNENILGPYITRPTPPVNPPTSSPTPVAPPTSAPMSSPIAPVASPPLSPPQASAPVSTSTPQSGAPLSAPLSAPSSSAPITPPTAPICNCAAPTPLCDRELGSVCVGQRVKPIVQCVERSNNQYTAYMTYNNEQATNVTLDDAINFLNVDVQNKVTVFTIGRIFTYPQSAFTVTTSSAQQVLWYLDGFRLAFNIDDDRLLCPQDVSFQMTSSATIEQLIAVSDSLIENLSDVMQVDKSRLNVTFSSMNKRQTPSTVITVVVKADQTSASTSSSQVVLDFVQTGFTTFTSRVPTASIASLTTVPPPNEQSGTAAVSPPTNSPTTPSTPTSKPPRSAVSGGAAVLVSFVMLGCTAFLV